MTRYVVLIYEQQSPDWPADMPPEVLQASEEFDGWIASRAGGPLPGSPSSRAQQRPRSAAAPSPTGRSIETKEALAGVYILEARDYLRHRPGRHDPGGERWRRGAPARSQVLENH